MWKMEMNGETFIVELVAGSHLGKSWTRVDESLPVFGKHTHFDPALAAKTLPKKPEPSLTTWSPDEVTIGFGRAVKDKDGKVIAVVEGVSDEDEMDRRARLIAASEDMLECLQYSLKTIRRHGRNEEMEMLQSYIDEIIGRAK